MKMTLALAFLALSLLAHAKDPCANQKGEIRLDKKAGLTIYNQGSSGHCYAAASAVIYDAYRGPNGNLTPGAVSPVHLASIFKNAIPEEGLTSSDKWGKIAGNIGGGDPLEFFGKAMATKPRPKLCSQKGTDEVWKNFMKVRYGEAFSKHLSTDDFMKYLERLYGAWWYYIRNNDKADPKKGVDEMERVRGDFSNGNFADGGGVVAPPNPCNAVPLQEQPALETLIGDMKHILHFDQPHQGQKGLVNFIRQQVDELCPESERITSPEFPEPAVAEASGDDKSPISNFIESQLCQTAAPVAISICEAGFFQGKAVRGADGKRVKCSSSCGSGATAKPPTCTGSDHVVAVVGRRINNGKVQYLVQNSWGKGFCDYNEPLKSNCDADGRIWIEASEVVDRTVKAVGFDKAPKVK